MTPLSPHDIPKQWAGPPCVTLGTQHLKRLTCLPADSQARVSQPGTRDTWDRGGRSHRCQQQPHPNCDNQQCLLLLPNVLGGGRNHLLASDSPRPSTSISQVFQNSLCFHSCLLSLPLSLSFLCPVARTSLFRRKVLESVTSSA